MLYYIILYIYISIHKRIILWCSIPHHMGGDAMPCAAGHPGERSWLDPAPSGTGALAPAVDCGRWEDARSFQVMRLENYGKIMENVGKMVENPFLEAQKQIGIPNSKVKFEMGTPQGGMIISQTSNWGPWFCSIFARNPCILSQKYTCRLFLKPIQNTFQSQVPSLITNLNLTYPPVLVCLNI